MDNCSNVISSSFNHFAMGSHLFVLRNSDNSGDNASVCGSVGLDSPVRVEGERRNRTGTVVLAHLCALAGLLACFA